MSDAVIRELWQAKRRTANSVERRNLEPIISQHAETMPNVFSSCLRTPSSCYHLRTTSPDHDTVSMMIPSRDPYAQF